jgi:hypothetical protein
VWCVSTFAGNQETVASSLVAQVLELDHRAWSGGMGKVEWDSGMQATETGRGKKLALSIADD